MANPKLEFYRFKLNHKKEDYKTFKDFAIEELGGKKKISDADAFKLCFKKFITTLESAHAKDEKRMKSITLIKKAGINKHHLRRPEMNISKNIFFGVINGGPYGKERIVSNLEDREDNTTLKTNRTVMLYYYIFVYLPSDHNEGFFMIHSNAVDESITSSFRHYISELFKGENYYKPVLEAFCPKSFQEEFKKGAVIKSISFTRPFVDSIHTTDAITNLLNEYTIRIEAIPKKGKVSMESVVDLYNYFAKKRFKSGDREVTLGEFGTQKINTENEITKTPKVFEWNTRDSEFVPVVHLEGRVEIVNGEPDFDELKDLCQNLFDEILTELRPDLDVKAK